MALQELVAALKTTKIKETKLVTPEFAANILANSNNCNRNQSDTSWAHYAQLLKEGKWTHDSEICFDVNEQLIDGQHRLKAIVETGISQELTIAKDLPVEARHNIDTGKLRSTKDTLDMVKCKNSAAVASGIMLYWAITQRKEQIASYELETGTVPLRIHRSEKNQYCSQMYEQHSELIIRASSVSMEVRNMNKQFNQSAVIAGILLAYDEGKEQEFTDFVRQVASMEGLIRGTAQHTLASSVNSIMNNRGSRIGNKYNFLAVLIHFFNRRGVRCVRNMLQATRMEKIQ